MQKEKTVIQVATGTLLEQFKWFLWYIFFTTLATVVVTFIISLVTNNYVVQASAFDSHHIFIFVIGALSAYGFLPFFVRHGITRRDYFIGSALAAVALSIVLTLIIGVLGFVDQWLVSELTSIGGFPETLSQFGTNPFTSTTLYILNILLYYVIGWFIGAGFYRFGWLIGVLAYVSLSLLFTSISDLFTNSATADNWLHSSLSSFLDLSSIPDSASIIGITILVLLTLWLIRLTTKRIPIKL